jgi:hypothetical protein
MNDWINVDDRLPKGGEKVLISIPVCGKANIESAEYMSDGQFLGCWCDRRGRGCCYKVTSWMPRPPEELK